MSEVEIRVPTWGDLSDIRHQSQPWLSGEVALIPDMVEKLAVRVDKKLVSLVGYVENMGVREVRMISTRHTKRHMQTLIGVLKHLLDHQPRPLLAYSFDNGKDSTLAKLCGFKVVEKIASRDGKVLVMELE